MEILKRNLVENQIVWFFKEPVISSDGLEYYNKKVTMQRLQFDGFRKHHGVKAACFSRPDGGRPKRFYDGIKGLLYHTEDEAKAAFENKILNIKKQILKNSKKMITKLEKNIKILESEI